MKNSSKFLADRLAKIITGTAVQVFLITFIAVDAASLVILTKEAKDSARFALNNSVLEIDKVLTEVESCTNSMSWIASEIKENPEAVYYITRMMLETDTTVIASAIAYEPYKGIKDEYYCMYMSYVDSESEEIVSKNMSGEDYEYQYMDWYQIPKLLGKPYWSEPSFDTAGSGRLIASYSVPLFDENGELFAVIKSDVSLDWLSQVTERFKPYPSAVTILYGRNGSVIAHSQEKSAILSETIFSDILGNKDDRGMEMRLNILDGGSDIVHFRYGGHMLYAAYAPLQNSWALVGLVSFIHFYDSTARINAVLFVFALLGVFSLRYITKKSIRNVSHPIAAFTYSASNMARGNFNAHIVDVDSEDEIKRLRDALKMLQTTINNYIDELKTTTASNQRFESELNIASKIQALMLPRNFERAGDVDLYATVLPAKEVGGDLYDFFKVGNALYFAVGDVSGKGVPASMFMAITRSAFHLVSDPQLGMNDSVSKLNNTFCNGNESGMFVTMFAARIDMDTLEMEYCNAGHNPVIIVSPEGKVSLLHAKPNIAAGLFPDFPYEVERLALEKGTRIIAYTDGVSEAENSHKDLFGEDRLLEVVASVGPDLDSKKVVDGILAKVHDFREGSDQNDDITLLTLKV